MTYSSNLRCPVSWFGRERRKAKARLNSNSTAYQGRLQATLDKCHFTLSKAIVNTQINALI